METQDDRLRPAANLVQHRSLLLPKKSQYWNHPIFWLCWISCAPLSSLDQNWIPVLCQVPKHSSVRITSTTVSSVLVGLNGLKVLVTASRGKNGLKIYILEHYFSGGPDPAYLGEALLVLACFQEPCLGFLILALRGCAWLLQCPHCPIPCIISLPNGSHLNPGY